MNENDADSGKGLYRKFNVTRTDGSSGPGGKHEHCRCYVLDLDHDPYAPAAIRAYADSCRVDYPLLAADLDAMVKPAMPDGSTTPIRVVCPEHGLCDIRFLTAATGPLEFILPCGCIMKAVGCDRWRRSNNSVKSTQNAASKGDKAYTAPRNLTCCFCRVTDGTVETAKTGTPMHRQCLRDAALGSMEDSLFPNLSRVADLNDEDEGG